jgi:hypothetical protein
MKRYVCTVAIGLLFALASTGTATAGLPLLGQSGTQVTSFGDQTVGEQKNDADVTQAQGNGNLNIAPAVAIFGDAETRNAQGNGNTATANVDQSNSVEQSQSSTQKQWLDQDGGTCCGGQSQTGTQTVYGGDQSVEKQKNEADVDQRQGNGNVNISPAIALFGDAETRNAQGNGNTATANVDQSNSVEQSQSSTQKQWLDQDGGTCCKPQSICEPKHECSPKGHSESPVWSKEKGGSCCDGQSQTGQQETTFGDQTVGEQKNDADVTQKQGNGNVNVSPAVALGGKHESCKAACEGSWPSHGGDAKTVSGQGNGNTASAWVDQSNSVTQTQEARQLQPLAEWCKGLITS